MSTASLLDRAALMMPKSPAVALGTSTVHTWAALADRSRRLAGHMTSKLGLKPGDRVLLFMKNVPPYIEVMFGCWYAGLVAVPVNSKLHAKEVAYILEHSRAAAAFVTADLATTFSEAAAGAGSLKTVIDVTTPAYQKLFAADPITGRYAKGSDLAWIFYTSGTTGRPKGAMLTHTNLLAMTTSYFIDVDPIAPGDTTIHAAPLSHASGLYVLPNVAGGATNVIPESGSFDALELFTLMDHWSGVGMFAAPTMVHRMVNHPAVSRYALKGLKTIAFGGAPMLVADVERALEVLGPKLAQVYGQGESPCCITGLTRRWYSNPHHPRWKDLLASAGFPQTVVEVAIMDDNDNDLPAGTMGEVCVRGEPVMRGYWENPEASAQSLRNGWLHTGDIGALDPDGFLTLMDRSKDMIISGGSNVYPREVEEVLQRHPAISEVSVIGRPHADWGEEVVAFVVLRPGQKVDATALDALCQENIARFKRPRDYRFIPELPKSNYGKILKRELRDLLKSEDSKS